MESTDEKDDQCENFVYECPGLASVSSEKSRQKENVLSYYVWTELPLLFTVNYKSLKTV